MDHLFGQFTMAILKLNQLVRKIKIAEVRELGLKAEHVMIVYFLSGAEAGLTAGQLVRLTLQDKAAVSRSLAFLRKKGFLTEDPGRYHAPIRLTPRGTELAAEIRARADEAVAACRMDFTEAERAFFYRSMLVLTQKLEAYCEGLSQGSLAKEIDSGRSED